MLEYFHLADQSKHSLLPGLWLVKFCFLGESRASEVGLFRTSSHTRLEQRAQGGRAPTAETIIYLAISVKSPTALWPLGENPSRLISLQ